MNILNKIPSYDFCLANASANAPPTDTNDECELGCEFGRKPSLNYEYFCVFFAYL